MPTVNATVARIAFSTLAISAPAPAALAQAIPGERVVYVFDFDFSINLPGEPVEDAVILPGQTIRWVWLADFHDVRSLTGSPEEFASDLFNAGDEFVYTFNNPGVYSYFCSPHGFDNGDGSFAGMGGTITVVPTPAAGPLAFGAWWAACRRRRPR